MGNVCVHVISNCVDFKSSSWVRPTDLIMDGPVKQQLPNKPPPQMMMLKEEKAQFGSSKDGPRDSKILDDEEEKAKSMQKPEIFADSEAKTQGSQEHGEKVLTKLPEHKQVLGIRPRPAVASGNIRKSHNVKRPLSAGLEAESVLKTKTGHLKEHYNLGDKLGHGQFGTTFICTEKGTGREYACKSIPKRKLETEEDVDDVRREIEIMHHLSGQPNVIAIEGTYEDSVAVHMVMELCKGGELFDRIVERGHYSERKAAQLAKVVVGVVLTCHSFGVMHRDLKPENFLFVNDQEDSPLKAIDFGLSVFFKPGDTFTDIVGSPYYVAPEVLNKRYGPEADIWSAGVMIYVLLCGSAPFWGETEEEIFNEVLYGDLDLSSDPWPQVSESAKDLIRKMLEKNPRRRLTARQVLSHPWIRDEGTAPDRPLDTAVLNRLKNFSAADKLKKMALTVIAQSLSEEEIGGLKETFEMIDADNNGQITYEELKDGFERLGACLDDSEVRAFMRAADVDNSGTIEYEEFIGATLNLNREDGWEEEEDRIRAAFMYFDKDGSGYITQDELQQACDELGVKDVRLEELISEVDQNNDGCIDYSEFIAMLHNENRHQDDANSEGRRQFRVEIT